MVGVATGGSSSSSDSLQVRHFGNLGGCVAQALPQGKVTPGGDLIAQQAGIGAVQYQDGRQEIHIVVEENSDDAAAVVRQYEFSAWAR